MTRRREEVVIEGTEDADDAIWQEYEFRAKPGDVHRRPPQLAPYHRRLDWLMWFAPLSPAMARQFLPALLDRLVDADPAVLRLLRRDPFGGRRPVRVRAVLYHYRFTTPGERRASGAWWHREPLGEFVPARGSRT